MVEVLQLLQTKPFGTGIFRGFNLQRAFVKGKFHSYESFNLPINLIQTVGQVYVNILLVYPVPIGIQSPQCDGPIDPVVMLPPKKRIPQKTKLKGFAIAHDIELRLSAEILINQVLDGSGVNAAADGVF